MTTSQITATTDLTNFGWDQLASLWGKYDDMAIAAGRRERDDYVLGVTVRRGASTRAQNRRDRVGEEVSRRGLVLRRSPINGAVMVGRPEHFDPIEQVA